MAVQEDLLALLTYPNETLSHEYKSWLDLSSNAGRATLAKAAIALGNHGGGIVVMGMRGDGANVLESQTRPNQIPRYTTDAVNAAINRYADPKSHYDVRFETHPITGVEHAFISIPPSTVPVMSTRLEDKVIAQNRCYIRKPGPKSEEPTTAEEWRSLLNRCIQAGRETMLDSIRTILQGHSSEMAHRSERELLDEFQQQSFERWQSLIKDLPTDAGQRLPRGHYQQTYEIVGIPPVSMKDMVRRLKQADQIQYTGWGPFVDIGRSPIGPMPVGDVIEAWLGYELTKSMHGATDADFWRVDPRGLLYEMRGFEEDFTDKAQPGKSFDAVMPIWRIGETLLYVSRLARTYEGDPLIRLRVDYSGLKGRKIDTIFDRSYGVRRGLCMTDNVTLRTEVSTSQIEDNLAEVIESLLAPLYEKFEFSAVSAYVIANEIKRLTRR
ncbi:hypothetical protein DXT91_16510 [Agrobacterium tumefaciens]|uniref:RNA-binding domain-containing protein n=1 Tax=Agrobacterium tumefaciens TaxID=358 RepID=UPI0012B6B03A|nr:RNA-binding domain-containing protein [Agrobacterium tumefaciens]MQB05719.1 hypothetical protein [Agrobacterium tumefaciens]